ncbi:MAG: hypothetical protein RLZZ227_1573 [Pseudomonadota bacterium]|jgi:FimV-like protein
MSAGARRRKVFSRCLWLQVLAVLLVSRAFAVSLGDELILSRLGDPVEIEIDVLQWEDIDLERVQISAASRAEYEVFNLTRLPVLDELRFNLVGPDLDGDVRVLISSRDPLNEPFLELLLVVRWPGGSLRHEYVLLFDPPGARVMATAVVAPAGEVAIVPAPTVIDAPGADSPARQPVNQELPLVVGPEPAAEPPTLAQSGAEPLPSFAAASPEPGAARSVPRDASPPAIRPGVAEADPDTVDAVPESNDSSDAAAPRPDVRTQVAIEVETLAPPIPAPALDTTRRNYEVRAGDSLWNIARQFTPAGAGVSLYQMLVSLHDLNRNSFINGNISLLKANAVLQVPAADDLARIDPLTADAEFDRRWDQGTQSFDPTLHGEPIPLFSDEASDEDLSLEVKDELPPGIEAPRIDADADGLVMVSSDEAQPLQIDTAGEAAAGLSTPAPAAPEPADTEVASAVTLQIETTAAQTQLPPPPASTVQPQESMQQEAAALAPTERSVFPATSPVREAVTADRQTVSRTLVAAELESEVELMRARRETAEALAQQLNATLQQAQAQKTAQGSFFLGANLLWTGGVFALFAAVLVAVVTSLKIAADLPLRRSVSSTVLERAEPVWFADAGRQNNGGNRHTEAGIAEMEVVELQMSDAAAVFPSTVTSAAVAQAASAEQAPKGAVDADLFARMDNLLGDDRPNSSKST